MEEKNDKIINVPIEDILPNRFQPRLAFDERELNELSNSILKYGVIQPIVLRRIGEKYEIIAGERRYKASVLAGLKTIPAIINNTDDNTSAEIALLENLQRKNLTVIEEAQSFKKLMDKGFTQEEISSKLGVSQSSIANKIRLLNLPRKVQDALLFNKISERHARSLLSLNDSEKQINLLDRIINERMTVKQTEEEISRLLNRIPTEEVDIPDGIKRFLNPEEGNNKEEKSDITDMLEIVDKSDEKPYNSFENKIISTIPDVVNIEEGNNSIENFEIKEPIIEQQNKVSSINPFQAQFKDNIRKIEEEVQNQRDSYYDEIINNDLKKSGFDFVELEKEKVETLEPSSEIELIDQTKEVEQESYNSNNVNIPNIISEIREFVKILDGNKKVISTKENDLDGKYQIIIEIDKSTK